METIEETKKRVLDNIEWVKPIQLGGQSCGMPNHSAHLKSEEMDIEIKINYHRSQIRNKELARILFELALDDIIK